MDSTLFLNGKIFQAKPQTNPKKQYSTAASSPKMESSRISALKKTSPFGPRGTALSPCTTSGGNTVLPGFIDGHMHLLMLGQSLQKAGLEHCQSPADIRSTIKSYAMSHPSAPRILCRGWAHPMTPGGVSTSMLDDLDPRPIFIDSKDLHSTWCNSAALAELGIDQTTPNPPGGDIQRGQGGQLTGLLSEAAAFNMVWPHLARAASLAERVAAMRTAVHAYSAAGYTGMVDMAMDDNAWEALQELRSQSHMQLPIRIAAYWLIRPGSTEAETLNQVDRAIELSRESNMATSPDCRVVGIKAICDGVVDACTAALTEPYSTGVSADPIWTAEQLKPVVRKATAAGLQVALHAIGDAAIRAAIDVLSTCSSRDLRPRIEHLELASTADAARLGAAGITASIQPVHADPAILRAWPSLLGPERCERAFAYREFADGGAALALGSDAPTAPYVPLSNVYIATTRRSVKGAWPDFHREPALCAWAVRGHRCCYGGSRIFLFC